MYNTWHQLDMEKADFKIVVALIPITIIPISSLACLSVSKVNIRLSLLWSVLKNSWDVDVHH